MSCRHKVGDYMKQCIFCGEKDYDTIIEHHTVPKCINPKWKKTIPVCQKCHAKIHKYVLKDMTNIVLALKENYNQMEETLNSEGIINNISFPTNELHTKLLKILVSNMPLINGTQKKIYINQLLILCELKTKPSKLFHLNSQKIGYALKKLGIKSKREQIGRCIVYDTTTINQLNKLQRYVVDGI